MGFVGYLFLITLKCFDLLAWPLFYLGYPLCASICAIESNSNSDTRKLIAYWVFYSLISLFEHAFMKLLEWLPFWPHMKLMIMYWLMIPHFSSALYFYELLVQPCLSLVPQIVINLFNAWKEPCLKRDDFPTEAVESYQKQNESEASEELISSDESKSIENNVGQKEDKDVEVTEENEDVEVTKENEDVAIERVTPIESSLVQTEKSTETPTDMNVSTPDFTEVQRKISLLQHQRNMNIHSASSNGLKEEVNIKQWDDLQINSKKIVQDTQSPLLCYICNVWCPSKDNLDAHLKEKKHLAQIQELANFVEVTEKNEDVEVIEKNEDVEVTEENEDVEVTEKNEDVEVTEENEDVEVTEENEEVEVIEKNEDVEVTEENEDVEVTEKNEVAAIERVTPIESRLVQTEKSTETLIDMNVSTPDFTEVQRKISLLQHQRNMNIHSASSNGLNEEVNIKQWDGLQINSKKIVQDTQSPLLCYICNVWCPSKDNLDAHLKEKKHLAQIQELANFVEVTEENEDVEVTEKNEDVEVIEKNEDVEVTEENEDVEVTEENEDVEVTEENEEVEVIEKNEDVEVTEENEDVEVTEKNEVAAIERVTPIESTLVQTGKSTETLTDMNVTSKSTLEFTEVRLSKKKDFTEVQKEWACAICKVTTQSETTLNSHLRGKRHKANCEVLKAITRAKKKNFPTSTTKKHEHTQTQKKCASSNGLKEEVNIKQWDVHGLQIDSKKIVLATLCYICNVCCPGKDNLDAHLKGKKHLARIRELANFVEGQHA